MIAGWICTVAAEAAPVASCAILNCFSVPVERLVRGLTLLTAAKFTISPRLNVSPVVQVRAIEFPLWFALEVVTPVATVVQIPVVCGWHDIDSNQSQPAALPIEPCLYCCEMASCGLNWVSEFVINVRIIAGVTPNARWVLAPQPAFSTMRCLA